MAQVLPLAGHFQLSIDLLPAKGNEQRANAGVIYLIRTTIFIHTIHLFRGLIYHSQQNRSEQFTYPIYVNVVKKCKIKTKTTKT